MWSIKEVNAEMRPRILGFSTLYSPAELFLFTMSYASSWQPSRIMFGNEMVGRISGANCRLKEKQDPNEFGVQTRVFNEIQCLISPRASRVDIIISC